MFGRMTKAFNPIRTLWRGARVQARRAQTAAAAGAETAMGAGIVGGMIAGQYGMNVGAGMMRFGRTMGRAGVAAGRGARTGALYGATGAGMAYRGAGHVARGTMWAGRQMYRAGRFTAQNPATVARGVGRGAAIGVGGYAAWQARGPLARGAGAIWDLLTYAPSTEAGGPPGRNY